ncbi:MAG: GNAT family N-acetyltransferase [Ignavibacteriae bacterium]|nr:GNAT family N-acetyltransferase [Ignavibacteriota bacterium]
MDLKIRKAKKSDAEGIINLIVELAIFEKLVPPDRNAQSRLVKHAFSDKPMFEILIALDDKTPIGYAFYFFTYSTFLAKQTMFLEDIFVSDRYRSGGVGKKLFDELLKIAKSKKCGRLDFTCLNWNKRAMKFYDRLGAKAMKEWVYYRMTL